MNLNKEIQFDLKAFFRWWGQGLLAWIPENIKSRLFEQAEEIVLQPEPEKLVIYRFKAGKKQRLARLDLNQLAQHYAELKQKFPELGKSRFILSLNSGQALEKELILPAAVKHNLMQVMQFELDKYTPFNAEQVYFIAQVLRQETPENITVLLALTPRSNFDTLYSQIIAADIPIDWVECDYRPDTGYRYNLLPLDKQRTKNRFMRGLIGGLGVLIGLLALGLVIVPVLVGEGQVEALRQQLKPLQKQIQKVQRQQQEIDGLLAETQELVALKQSIPTLNEILFHLTHLLPDNTWLTHFKLQDDSIQIQGQSGTASNLIEILESSPVFENVRFISPLTQDKRTGKERFQISAQLTKWNFTDE